MKEKENLKKEEKGKEESYKWECKWCGEKYVERPFLCECKSNCFLVEIGR